VRGGRALLGCGLLLPVVITAAVVLVGPATGAPSATCTYEQKQVRAKAAADYKQRMAADRAAYFKTHKSPKQRSAFVKSQQKKLAALRRGAACTVPPLPPSSPASCAFQLAPHPGGQMSEGRLDPRLFRPSTGRIDAVIVFLDYPDAPGGSDPAPLAQLLRPDPAWFEEVSYGRVTMSISAPVTQWIRMPAPTTAYMPTTQSIPRYVRDALAAADPFVDFSRFNHVTFWNSPGWASSNPAISLPLAGGAPIPVDGTTISFGNLFTGDIGRLGSGIINAWTHEVLHTFGLPDLGGRAIGWDPISVGNDPPGLTHLLGWHKWLLGWLEPTQLTCLTAAGTVEETLTPIAVKNGKKLVVAPINDHVAYVVEARARIGYDKYACDEGVIVYTVDSSRSNYEDPIILHGQPRCGSVTPGAFRTGGVHDDGSVKVEVLATDGRNYRVRVTKK
jgi:M6 family metalloprotease-like protein